MMNSGTTVGVFLALLMVAGSATGADDGRSVVVVYNTRVADSKKVALHYAERRRVPAEQVIGLRLPTGETMSRGEFRDDLLRPLFAELRERKLFTFNTARRRYPLPAGFQPLIDARVRYLVLCHGVPLKIARDPGLREEGVEKLREELRRNEAAVDSELALLPWARERMMLAGPAPNPFYAITNAGGLSPTNGIMMVARLDGPSAEIATGLVDKALLAESNGFWGRAYFDARGVTNAEYKLGDDWITASAQIARRLGFDTVLDEGPSTFPDSFPLSHIALYAGWYDHDVSGPFTREKVEFMPGAFAYHLHSFSAATIRSERAHWVGPLLAKGATITFGSVDEPYLTGTPNVAVFIERLIHGRFTFGEAAYAAQSVISWQTTVVGDPLFRPFGERPDVLHHRLEGAQNPHVEWSHLRVINLNQVTGLPIEELLKYLRDVPLTKTSAVLQEKLGDLHLAEKRLSAACEAYQQAVALNPSREQKTRLLLTIGELQSFLGREMEAFNAFQQLVTDIPEYPKILQVYHRMIPLARTLGKEADVEKIEAAIKRLTPASGQ